MRRRNLARIACAALCLGTCAAARAQFSTNKQDSGNRINNPFRTQFKPAWTLTINEPVKLVAVGPVTDSKRSNLVLLVSGRNATDTQRKIRVLHWNGSGYDTDGESVSQSIGIDTLLLGKFHPGAAPPTVVPTAIPAPGAKQKKPRDNNASHGLQILTNTGIYAWSNSSLQPLFARQLPDVKQSLILDNHPDMVIVGSGDGATAFEFTDNDMRPAAKERLSGGGYAHFGIGLQSYTGSDNLNLSPGIRFAQAVWAGRDKWLIGLVRGQAAATVDDPKATTGDRLVVYTPKFSSRDKSFWETRSDDLEESWRSDPIPGQVLDVRVGDPHNDGRAGILVLSSENDGHDRRLTFYAIAGNG